jgi:hypothetical protein
MGAPASGAAYETTRSTSHVPEPRVNELDLRRGLRSAVVGSAVPYGYTITVFSSGQSVIRAHGSPQVPMLLLFALGAVIAYAGLRWSVRGVPPRGAHLQLGESPSLLRTGALQVVAIVVAILVADGAAQLPTALAWPGSSFTATLFYLAIVAYELALIERQLAARAPAPERR